MVQELDYEKMYGKGNKEKRGRETAYTNRGNRDVTQYVFTELHSAIEKLKSVTEIISNVPQVVSECERRLSDLDHILWLRGSELDDEQLYAIQEERYRTGVKRYDHKYLNLTAKDVGDIQRMVEQLEENIYNKLLESVHHRTVGYRVRTPHIKDFYLTVMERKYDGISEVVNKDKLGEIDLPESYLAKNKDSGVVGNLITPDVASSKIITDVYGETTASTEEGNTVEEPVRLSVTELIEGKVPSNKNGIPVTNINTITELRREEQSEHLKQTGKVKKENLQIKSPMLVVEGIDDEDSVLGLAKKEKLLEQKKREQELTELKKKAKKKMQEGKLLTAEEVYTVKAKPTTPPKSKKKRKQEKKQRLQAKRNKSSKTLEERLLKTNKKKAQSANKEKALEFLAKKKELNHKKSLDNQMPII